LPLRIASSPLLPITSRSTRSTLAPQGHKTGARR
jgi:hypothetical protein